MIKDVTIGNKTVKFKSSAAVPHMYRRRFGRDIFVDMDKMQRSLKKNADGTSEINIEVLEMFECLAYCFAKHADPEGVPDDPETWLEGFEMLDIYQVLPELISMWAVENKGTSVPKKKSGKQTAK